MSSTSLGSFPTFRRPQTAPADGCSTDGIPDNAAAATVAALSVVARQRNRPATGGERRRPQSALHSGTGNCFREKGRRRARRDRERERRGVVTSAIYEYSASEDAISIDSKIATNKLEMPLKFLGIDDFE